MEKKIFKTRSGREYVIGFDFACLLSAEEEIGKSFAQYDEQNRGDVMKFLYGALKENNELEPYKEWLRTFKNIFEAKELYEALGPDMERFFRIPEIAEAHVEDEGESNEEEESEGSAEEDKKKA